MTIDATTGTFNYTPAESDVAKDFAVSVRVTDNAHLAPDEASFALHIIEMDQPPAVAAITNSKPTSSFRPFRRRASHSNRPQLAATIWLPAAER